MYFYGKITGISVEKHKEYINSSINGELNCVYVLIEPLFGNVIITKKMRIDNFFRGWFPWKKITNKKIGIIRALVDELKDQTLTFSEEKDVIESKPFIQELCKIAMQKKVSGL